jgi:hypothetical protein
MMIWFPQTWKAMPLYNPVTQDCNGAPPMLSKVQLNCDCLAHCVPNGIGQLSLLKLSYFIYGGPIEACPIVSSMPSREKAKKQLKLKQAADIK